MTQYRRTNKYRAKRTEYGGRTYASKAEAARAQTLDLLLKAGEVCEWSPQPLVVLGPAKIKYRPDFHVYGPQGVWYEDVKGVEDRRFKVIKQLWRVHGPAPLHVIHKKETTVIEVKP